MARHLGTKGFISPQLLVEIYEEFKLNPHAPLLASNFGNCSGERYAKYFKVLKNLGLLEEVELILNTKPNGHSLRKIITGYKLK